MLDFSSRVKSENRSVIGSCALLRAVKLVFCATLLTTVAKAQTSGDWRIDTFAGRKHVTENVPATEARLSGPYGVATDSAGNLYIADGINNRIRKVDPSGIITTFAGTGENGYGGDGGPATEALLNCSRVVEVDSAGNVYIAESCNNRVRKVDPAGIITTIVGTGEHGYGGDGGPATEAIIRSASGVTVDAAGNLYIADYGDHRVRKVDSSGLITTFAGLGWVEGSWRGGYSGDGGPANEARLNGPNGVATDGSGNLYIADRENHRIRKVDSSGTISTIAGLGERGYGGDGGPATEARLTFPAGLATDVVGNLYITDQYNHRIRKVDYLGIISTIAGTGKSGFDEDGSPATEARLARPSDVAIDGAGNLYIADTENYRIRKVDPSGFIYTVAGTESVGDGGPASEASLFSPFGVGTDGVGNLYIADSFHARVRKVDSSGIITTVAGSGKSDGRGVRSGTLATENQLAFPMCVAADRAGNIYIGDGVTRVIYKVDSLGIITTFAGSIHGYGGDGGPATSARLADAVGIAVDDVGNLYIADESNQRIRKVDSSGIITTIAGTGEKGYGGDSGPATEALLNDPWGVAVDAAGNLYIADNNNNRIRKVDPSGIITTVAGSGDPFSDGGDGPATEAWVSGPAGLATDADGNIYIAERGSGRIRMLDTSGIITTIAGMRGRDGDDGDGGLAIEADLKAPMDVAVDADGNIYIADQVDHRIRILTPPPTPSAIPTIVNQIDFIFGSRP